MYNGAEEALDGLVNEQQGILAGRANHEGDIIPGSSIDSIEDMVRDYLSVDGGSEWEEEGQGVAPWDVLLGSLFGVSVTENI